MFYLICEGGVHTVAYFHNHDVYPDKIIFDSRKVKDYIPYLDADDDILIVIHGLTEWTMAEVYSLMNDLRDVTKAKAITILSDVDLMKMPMSYHFYSGDLFEATRKEKDAKGKTTEIGLMDGYLGYNIVKSKPDIIEKEIIVDDATELSEKRKEDYDELSKRVVRIMPYFNARKATKQE